MKSILFILITSVSALAQGQSSGRQRALNNYVAYANQSANDVTSVFKRSQSYYARVQLFLKHKNIGTPRFECTGTPEEYYFNNAITESKILTDALILNQKANALHLAAATIDLKCKALDTYHKLEDYKQDNFKQALVLIGEIRNALAEYGQTQRALAIALDASWQKLIEGVPAGPYHTMDIMMKKEIARERAFLDLWTFNFNDDIHTGWPVEDLQTSITETDAANRAFSETKLPLEYPASTMAASFTEALGSVLSTKRAGLDGYNYEAKQSDQHSNEVYLDLINDFNGVLIAAHNGFINYAVSNGYYGLASINYVPLFDLRSVPKRVENRVQPFQDIAYSGVKPVPQTSIIPNQTAASLELYVDFINESLRQVNYMMNILRNYNAYALNYKGLKSFKGKGGLTFSPDGFKIPLSLYQAATANTMNPTPVWKKSLNDQASVLLNIMKETEQLGIALAENARTKAYESDDLGRAYEILERNALLFELWDTKKERLYKDARSIAGSYREPPGSWSTSHNVLLKLVDEDRVQLAAARVFLKGDTSISPSAAAIDTDVRDIISNEYANMKGIEQLGRSNGLCPYTPYEDLPKTSRTFSEKLAKIRKARQEEYFGPYHNYVYLYNLVVEDYNKFAGLAPIAILKTVAQPEYFSVAYPETKAAADAPRLIANSVTPPVPERSEDLQDPPVRRGRVIHDTIRVTDIIRIETQRKDTVYIEKHDTIYRDRPGEEKLLSMDGYASNNLVFLLDVSGSMNTGQKLPLLKKSMLLLLKILREEDRVSIVVYSGKARTVLVPTSAREQDKIRKVIENLRSEGNTDGNAGIKLAYKTADGNYLRGGNNRIILATDGEFPVSAETLALIRKYAAGDIFLSVFNFGQSQSSATVLQSLSTSGRGNYAYITRQNSDIKLIAEAKGKRK